MKLLTSLLGICFTAILVAFNPSGNSEFEGSFTYVIKTQKPDKVEKTLLDLRRRGLLDIMPQDGDEVLVFRPETLSRIKKIKEWLPRFEMDAGG